ncbi:uncharacterized protein LOC124173312 [Ischnura elegans]|uniref:uncharacterized protein LOC124173312 n=1 Tax=Ischnura elegans TaxID=197161 RepID=UPI001ED8A4E4|nr:uncharacterized protein LOC124173312 [Ischnura elegans]
MNRSAGIFTASSERDSVGTLCRLCMKNNDYYYNIFTFNVACRMTVKDAIYGLLGLEVAVGDGLPTTLCPLCLKKLTEFSIFKMTCLQSDAKLRKLSGVNCFRSIQGEEAADDKLETPAETNDCIRDVIEGTSHLTFSPQRTEIYIPVEDSQQLGSNMLVTMKEENEDPLSEDSYPVMYTLDPAGIPRNALDPLETDDLSGLGTCGSPCVKADQTSDDEGGYVHNDSMDGATDDLVAQTSAQAQASTSSKGEEVDAESTRAVVIDLDTLLVLTKKELSPKKTDATEWTVTENGELVQNPTMAIESMTETEGLPAPDRVPLKTTSTTGMAVQMNAEIDQSEACFFTSATVTNIGTLTGACHAGEGRNVTGKDLESCGALHADEMTSCSIPDDGGCNTKCIPGSKTSEDGAIMTFAQGRFEASNTTDSLRFIRICKNRRSGTESVVGDKEMSSKGLVENSGKIYPPSDSVHLVFTIRDGLNTRHRLIKHLDIDFGGSNFDTDAEPSVGRGDTIKTLTSTQSCDNPHAFTTSKTLKGLNRKRKGVKQKGNMNVKVISGERGGKNVRGVRRNSFVDNNLTVHMHAHRGEKPYSCDVCKKSFSRKQYLAAHCRTHSGEKPYACRICCKSFNQSSTLAKHKRTHTGEKPYSCNVCSNSFTQRHSLDEHMRIHTGEKPYTCDVCNKSFSRKGGLVIHCRTHSGERPFSCSICCKSFSERSVLARHMLTHTGKKPYSCGVCHKSFSKKCNLVIHCRTHSGERPFSCSICCKSFYQNGVLTKHMLTHTGEKPYSCGVCHKSFSKKCNLDRHKRTHAGYEPYV